MTHPPSADEVKVATDTLRKESGIWDDQIGELNKVVTKVGGMELGRIEAGLFQMIVDAYNDVVHAVVDRCREGLAAMTEVGQTLQKVADTYDAEDKAQEHRIRNVY